MINPYKWLAQKREEWRMTREKDANKKRKNHGGKNKKKPTRR